MKKVQIKFDPYKMKTKIIVDNKQVQMNKHCNSKLKKYLDDNTPMPIQNWIDPIPRDNWKGLLHSLCEMGDKDFSIDFTGRRIDYLDVIDSLNAQNTEYNCNAKLDFMEIKHEISPDEKMKNDISDVINMMLKKEFTDLVEKSTSSELKLKYTNLRETYEQILNEEFRIVFTGTYSSGKSSIINALIGKNILPTATSTCTSVICKIKHESDMQNLARVEYILNDKKISYNCTTEMEVQTQIKAADDSIELIEVYTDLSKLYPSPLDKTMKLVLIDTPGTDSALGNDSEKTDDGKRRLFSKSHIDVTREILRSKQKEIIILVADDKFEDDNIVELLDIIEESASADDGAYNDRFLFVMNMCDSLTYSNEGETIKNYIDNFISNIKKIPDTSKLRNILNPRVFPITSGAALAVYSGYTIKPSRDERKTKKAELFNYYEDFAKKIYYEDLRTLEEAQYEFDEAYTADLNYCLEKHSSISLRSKKKFESELEQPIGLSERILMHSGVPALEIAIHEYISHFAFPIKVRSLLESFSDILLEIDNYNSMELKELKAAKERLDSTLSLKSKKELEESEEIKKEAQIRLINTKIMQISHNIDEIKENTTEINGLRSQLLMLRNIFTKNGIKDEMEETEGKRLLKEIIEEVETVLSKIRETIFTLKKEKRKTTEFLYQELMSYIDDLRKMGLLQDGHFSLEDTVMFQDIVNKEHFKDPVIIRRSHENPNKRHLEVGLDLVRLFNSIGGAWKTRKEPDVIYRKYINVKEYIAEYIEPLEIEMDRLVEAVRENYSYDIQTLKQNTKERVKSIEKLFEKVKADLSEIRVEARKIAKDSQEYKTKIGELEKQKEFLESLIAKIEYISDRG